MMTHSSMVPLHVLETFGVNSTTDNGRREIATDDFKDFLRLINRQVPIPAAKMTPDSDSSTRSRISPTQQVRGSSGPQSTVFDETVAAQAFATLDNGTGVVRHPQSTKTDPTPAGYLTLCLLRGRLEDWNAWARRCPTAMAAMHETSEKRKRELEAKKVRSGPTSSSLSPVRSPTSASVKKEAIGELFKSIDADRDGSISSKELVTWAEANPDQFQAMAAGQINPTQADSSAAGIFASAYVSSRASLGPSSIRPTGVRVPASTAGRRQPLSFKSLMRQQVTFDEVDTNGDGAISMEEFARFRAAQSALGDTKEETEDLPEVTVPPLTRFASSSSRSRSPEQFRIGQHQYNM